MLLAMPGSMTDESMIRLNANAISGAANGVAAVAFAFLAPMHWAFIPPLAAGFLLGGPTGPRLVRKLPQRAFRVFVALCGLALAVKLGFSAYRLRRAGGGRPGRPPAAARLAARAARAASGGGPPGQRGPRDGIDRIKPSLRLGPCFREMVPENYCHPELDWSNICRHGSALTPQARQCRWWPARAESIGPEMAMRETRTGCFRRG
jgi:Sulfite exporter TauE/SafE